MLAVVRTLWKANPDLRLGQIVSSAARGHSGWPDVFSIEDDDLMKGLQKLRR